MSGPLNTPNSNQFHLYLATVQSNKNLTDCCRNWDFAKHPMKMLFTFAYAKNAVRQLTRIVPREHLAGCMLDSGAFTAWTQGIELKLDAYIEFWHRYSDWWDCVVALDKVGDPLVSWQNAREMVRQGVGREHGVIPVYHIGEDIKWLKRYCRNYEHVGLSCRFGESLEGSYRFYRECFKACWPHRFHSFGFASRKVLLQFPFQTADTSSFLTQSLRYGVWKEFGHLPMKDSDLVAYGVKSQILHALKLEREIQTKWYRVLQKEFS